MMTKRLKIKIKGLQDKIETNKKTIQAHKTKISRIEKSQTKNKIYGTIGLAYLPYISLGILFGNLYNFGKIGIPIELSTYIIVGGSLGIGELARIIITRKTKQTSSEKELLLEKIESQFEIERLTSKNEINKKVLSNYKKESEEIHDLSKKYNIQENEPSTDYEKSKKLAQMISEQRKNKYEELYTLLKKNVLQDEFKETRSKKKLSILLTKSILIGLASSFGVAIFPAIMSLTNPQQLSMLTIPLTVMAPGIVGCFASGLYLKKRDKIKNEVFNSLNNELGENALSNVSDDVYTEMQSTELKIETIINEIVQLEENLCEQNRIVESSKPKYEYTFDKNQPKLYYETEEYQISGQYTFTIPKGR